MRNCQPFSKILHLRCFDSNVDTPVGYNLSRLLASTVVGSRKEPIEEREEPNDEDGGKKDEKKEKVKYRIVGTLAPELGYPVAPSNPGEMAETGDKKRGQAQREAIEKFAIRGERPIWVQDIVRNEDREVLKNTLLHCDVIIYDLNQCLEEASWAIEILAELSNTFLDRPKTFISLSSIMTWAKTKVDQDDPEAFLAEDEYRRRKPCPNYKNHVQIEKLLCLVLPTVSERYQSCLQVLGSDPRGAIAQNSPRRLKWMIGHQSCQKLPTNLKLIAVLRELNGQHNGEKRDYLPPKHAFQYGKLLAGNSDLAGLFLSFEEKDELDGMLESLYESFMK
ncbi:UNVERIFIED_CONTAM: Adenylate kinase 7 [Siphonaria sp. JEL0065]|nr:Adenylate kinase 7 [Siphonaria sp. JEL0065]